MQQKKKKNGGELKAPVTVMIYPADRAVIENRFGTISKALVALANTLVITNKIPGHER
jgi:hypothetical protein